MKTTLRAVAVGGAFALVGLSGITPAPALPPGGANTSDTPGTTSTVSPRTLEACETLSYTVTGFPAGETVNVKIDDGIGYGDTSTQYTGVISQTAADSGGTARGSFELPCDIAEGEHWLRFLATEVVGEDGSTKGYSNRGDSDFTVVSGAGGNNSADGTDSGSGAGSVSTAKTTTAAAAAGSKDSATSDGARRTTTRVVQVQEDGTTATVAVDVGAEPAVGGASGRAAATVAQGAAASASVRQQAVSAGTPADGAVAVGTTLVANPDGSTEEVIVYEDPATGEQVAYTAAAASAAGNGNAPWVGLLTGGSILIVGFAGIAAYLFTDKKRREVAQ